MGPTNVALVQLYRADQALREAQERLDAAAKNVRVQERKVADLEQKLKAMQASLREQQARSGNLDLDLKTRDAHIEKLRSQQQTARNNKEYQALLVEINTHKVDRGKVEEEALKVMDTVEKAQAEAAALAGHLEAERAKLNAMREQSSQTLAGLKAEVEALQPARDAAAAKVPPKWLDAFDRLADRFDGEAMAPITKPYARREEYACGACNMDLVTDVYNKLHSRDEPVFCPSCRRMLYIPEDLPPETAVKTKPVPRVVTRAPRAAKPKKAAATAGAASEPAATTSEVEIELRAKGKLGEVLAKAQGETVRSANAAGTRPVECEVYIDDRLAGIYKGQTPEHLERAVRYYLGEAGIPGTVRVQPAPDEDPAAAGVPDATGTPEAAEPLNGGTDSTSGNPPASEAGNATASASSAAEENSAESDQAGGEMPQPAQQAQSPQNP